MGEEAATDAVAETTSGVGSEALTAITNLGGGSGSAATGVVSRIAATFSGKTGGFAPKVITTVTKHGIAGIERVEPIEGVERGYRAVAEDANGLETVRTVLDLDPMAYDVTVTREDGAGVVEFVQRADTEESAASGTRESENTAASGETGALAPVKGTEDRTDHTGTEPARTTGPQERSTGRRAPPRRAVESSGVARGEVERAQAEAEKVKAEAAAEKARAEAERARAEAEAAKARAEAERARAEAEAEAVRRESGKGPETENGHSDAAPEVTSGESATDDPAFSASRVSGFDPNRSATTHDAAGGWGLSDESTDRNAGIERTDAANVETVEDEGQSAEVVEDDGFGGFTSATPVENEGGEFTDGGQQSAVADGGASSDDGSENARTENRTRGDAVEGTGAFQF